LDTVYQTGRKYAADFKQNEVIEEFAYSARIPLAGGSTGC
jgi:hypothetical protein